MKNDLPRQSGLISFMLYLSRHEILFVVNDIFFDIRLIFGDRED